MIRLALALWLALTGLAFAAPVTVKSGEHEGFTRLVLDFGAPVNWTVGRTLDGYELRLDGNAPTYDLTEAFDIIGKSRLAAIWADPATNALQVGIACACHAIPFEFRPGIVVIDLRDGPPPKGSSFELALDGSDAPVLAGKPAPRPRPRPGSGPMDYVWTDLALAGVRAEPVAPAQLPPSSDPAMEPLRASLLRQLSRGAAQGVVNMALPDQASAQTGPAAKTPSVRIGLGELPGVSMGTGLPDHADLGADGESCVAATVLDFASWGSDAPVSEQISAAMAGLIGEFDKPDPEALARAVHFQLFLGFGAEAQQLLRAFPNDLPEAPVWRSLANILDQTPDSASAFLGQAACDTPAALWAVLSDPAPAAGEVVNADAALLAFSALPVPLRRHLGPRLADRFLALGDGETAGAIRNAILRAPGETGPGIGMLEAEIDMSNGDPAEAEARLDDILADPGPGTPAAMVAMVAARVAQDLPIEPTLVVALEALLTEQTGSPEEVRTRQALTLAQAASGDFEAALAALPQSPVLEPDVWRLLAKIGVDDALLAHAVLAADQSVPDVPAETAAKLAERLLGFGLAAAAQRWIAPSADSVLQARAQLARHDARAALSSLAGLETAEALMLRAEALRMLEDGATAQAFADAGDPVGQRLALARLRDWPQLAALQADGWTPVISALADVPADPTAGPLGKGHQLADHSAQTRAAVADLLAIVVAPKISAP